MISVNDRLKNPERQQEGFFSGRQAMMWTALPGIIQSWDPVAMTCEVQPAIMGKNRQEDGSVKAVNLPLLLDCPVVFPHAGGCSLTFPIKAGDECLVVFACRAIDLWWQSGGVQPPAETRMHDLSDGFVIPGPYSQPKVIPEVNTEYVELRSDDRQAWIAIHPTTHEIRVETRGDENVVIDGNMTGHVLGNADLTVDGNTTATVGGNLTATVQGTTTATLQGAVSVTCGSTLTAEVSGATTLKCPTLTVDCPTTTFTGQVMVQGLLTGTGGFNISGGSGATAQVSGDIALQGSMDASGDVVAGGISLTGHTHTAPHGETSGPH